MRRALVLLCGIGILLCLGTVYSYSVFRVALEQTLGVNAVQSGLPYMLALFFYALFMPLTGRFLDRFPPHWISMFGGVLMSLGWILAGSFPSFLLFTIFYGILGGVGVGIAYGIPLVVASRVYPEKPGSAIGLTVTGFGLSPFITAPIAQHLIRSSGLLTTLRTMGGAFLLINVILSLLLKLSNACFPQNRPKETPTTRTTTFEPQKFWKLWFLFFTGTFVGLTTIGLTTPVAKEIVGLPGQTAALSVSLFALFNGLGRPLFGYFSDRKGFQKAALGSYCLLLLALSLFFFSSGNRLTYFLSFAVLWMNLGAWLSIAPSATLQLFGSEAYGRTYGLLFTAYGASALGGTFIASLLRDFTGSYLSIFPVNLLLVLSGLGALLIMKKEHVEP